MKASQHWPYWIWLLAVITLALPLASKAELPPQAYIDDANQASDVVRLEVLLVKKKTNDKTTIFDVTAKVVEVRHSLSGLKPGNQIRISYATVRRSPGWVGPGQPPMLKEAVIVPAFIEPDGIERGLYRVAARSQSFSEWLWEKSAPGKVSVDGNNTFMVRTKVSSPGCGSSLSSADEIGKLIQDWKTDNHLQVQISQLVNSRIHVVEQVSHAQLEGNILNVFYQARIEPLTGGPVPTCLKPVQVTFDIYGVPKQDYEIRLKEQEPAAGKGSN